MSLEREDGQNTEEPSERIIQAGIGFGARIPIKVYQAPESYKNPLKTVNIQPEEPGRNSRPPKLASVIAEMKQRFPRGVFSAFSEFAPQGTITEIFSSTQDPS